MQIAETAAGYTAAEADTLRRAMSKKKAEEMAGERARFLRGAAERGFDRKDVYKRQAFIARSGHASGLQRYSAGRNGL